MPDDQKAFARTRSFRLIGGPLDGEEQVVSDLSGPVYFTRRGPLAYDRFAYEWRIYRMRGDYGNELFHFLVYVGLSDREAERLIMPQLVALKLPSLACVAAARADSPQEAAK
jgi:hypothetical protein